jgi:DMSO/TMAO reductase YedYZ heme-binding membrane subunit
MPFWWVLARASGVASFVLITASMVAGVVLRSRLVQRVASPVAKMEWHRVLAVLGMAMAALHGVALVMDDYIEITPLDLVAPGYIDYRPLWVAFGVLSMWLMVIVSVTASMRKHVGAGVWKPLHLLSYGVFVTAAVHGVMSGTDSGRPWMMALYLGSVALIVALASRRLLAGPNAPLKRRRQPAPAPGGAPAAAPVPAGGGGATPRPAVARGASR